jgi:hypothetical protein
MHHTGGFLEHRRRFLVSGLSLVGCAVALGPVAMFSGCGDADKSAGQVEAVDVTKTQSAQDSMKAYQEQMQKKTGTKKR